MEAEVLKKAVCGATLSAGCRTRKVECEGKRVGVHVWDTAGLERFRAITRNYYHRAQGILLVYDVTRRDTFDALQSWYDEIKKYARDGVVVALVGNKIDEQDSPRQVSYQEGHEFAQRHDILFFEVSAFTGQRVEDTFTQVIRRMLVPGARTTAGPAARSVELDNPSIGAAPTTNCWC
ncbi:uncharacterized protein PHACADRAFT_263174 [Phanerochaete carnosa HHB-10118-sp]|uniref:Uncharacterized protein n=1 Tax=Phanerochaete carnosa (strain HHB-10118-sp) TaxID=650164 RepID=K5VIQ5_PHACS|nr:uncharacterized protein PHACADRAFT_263174 [Phanerochaete carnosa HHB-10118-sp]EKM51168.1 hypothetical protein PHACADRAFT_263174 [Phanerochaete carnosa HHB-10118-sp]